METMKAKPFPWTRGLGTTTVLRRKMCEEIAGSTFPLCYRRGLVYDDNPYVNKVKQLLATRNAFSATGTHRREALLRHIPYVHSRRWLVAPGACSSFAFG